MKQKRTLAEKKADMHEEKESSYTEAQETRMENKGYGSSQAERRAHRLRKMR